MKNVTLEKDSAQMVEECVNRLNDIKIRLAYNEKTELLDSINQALDYADKYLNSSKYTENIDENTSEDRFGEIMEQKLSFARENLLKFLSLFEKHSEEWVKA